MGTLRKRQFFPDKKVAIGALRKWISQIKNLNSAAG